MKIFKKKFSPESAVLKQGRLKRFFSLIEVAIAAGIITAGATAAVLLLPIGLRENMDSSGRNYTASAIQTIKAYILSRIATVSDFEEALTVIPEMYPPAGTQGIYAEDPELILNCINKAMNTEGVFRISYDNSSNAENSGKFTAEIRLWRSMRINNNDGYIEVLEIPTGDIDEFNGNIVSSDSSDAPLTISSGGISNLTPEGIIPEEGSATSLTFNNGENPLYTGSFNFAIEGLLDLKINSTNVKSITLTAADEENPFTYVPDGDSITNLSGNIKIAFEFNSATVSLGEGDEYQAAQITGSSGMGYFFTEPKDAPVSELIGYGINAEISWPIEKSYSQREKSYYYFEIYKQ